MGSLRANTQGTKDDQKPEIDPAIIDELMKGYQRPEDMTGPGGILEQLTLRADSGRGVDPLSGIGERPGPGAGGQEAPS